MEPHDESKEPAHDRQPRVEDDISSTDTEPTTDLTSGYESHSESGTPSLPVGLPQNSFHHHHHQHYPGPFYGTQPGPPVEIRDRSPSRERPYIRYTTARRDRSQSPQQTQPWTIYDVGSEPDELEDTGEPFPEAWVQPKTLLEDGTATELLVAQSLEHRMSKSGTETIALVCSSGPPASSLRAQGQSRAQFRWLHVQKNTVSGNDLEVIFQTLERFVLDCPFISSRMRAIALRMLRGHNGRVGEAGRDIGMQMFAEKSVPSTTRQFKYVSLDAGYQLVLAPLGEATSCTQTLLRMDRGYDLGTERELNQTVRKMGVGNGRDVLHVATLWILSLGPGVLITLSCVPLAYILGSSVEIDNRAGHGMHTVQVKLYGSEACCNIIIDPVCSYVDFLQHAIAVAASGTRTRDATEYDILYKAHSSDDPERFEVLTPSTWLKLLVSETLEKEIFYVKPRFRSRSRSRRPYYRDLNTEAPPYHSLRSRPFLPPSRQDTGATMDPRVRNHYQPRTLPFSPDPSFQTPGTGGKEDHARASALEQDDERYGNYSSALVLRNRGESFPDDRARPERSQDFVPPLAAPTGIITRALVMQGSPAQSVHGSSATEDIKRPDAPGQSGSGAPAAKQSLSDHRRGSESSNDSAHARVRRLRRHRGDFEHSDDSKDVRVRQILRRRESSAYSASPDGFHRGRTDERLPFRPSLADAPAAEKEMPQRGGTGAVTVPFFAWRVRSDKDSLAEHRNPDDAINNLMRILLKVEKSIASEKSGVGELYAAAYRCTKKSLLERHPSLTQQPTQNPRTETGESAPLPTQVGEDAKQTNTKGKSPEPAKEDDAQPQTSRSPLGDLIYQGEGLVKQLFEISEAILSAFLPKDERHLPHHILCTRFWGILDDILRQFRWSTEHSRKPWKIRDFDTISSSGIPVKCGYSECIDCSSRSKKYSSASEALCHLHDVHFECPVGEMPAGKGGTPGDPCYAYIQCLDQRPVSGSDDSVMELKEFIDNLSDISGKLNRVHWLVATNSREVQHQPHLRKIGDTPPEPSPPPPLPASLVYVFEELVIYYVLEAKRLSIENRATAAGVARKHEYKVRHLYDRAFRLRERCIDKQKHIKEYLQQAQGDVILSRGDPMAYGYDTNTALGIKAFDSTSLPRILPPLIVDSTFSMKLSGRTTSYAKDIPLTEDSKWDVIELYKEYSKRLHFESARRPRRRLFLAIHAFEDELTALKTVLEWALRDANLTIKEFSQEPMWEERYREPRKAVVELHYLTKRRELLSSKIDEVIRLQESSKELRERVKQLIEITDEDHGKAIRVFTIVTIFFLPLTFISGFFGMNTSDIRDIEAGQSLYWTISIPVTAVVLMLAFVYGYKGDEVGDWIHDRVQKLVVSRSPWWMPHRRAALGQQKALANPAEDFREKLKWPMDRADVKEVWNAVKDSSSWSRRRRGDPEVLRRSTFQSV